MALETPSGAGGGDSSASGVDGPKDDVRGHQMSRPDADKVLADVRERLVSRAVETMRRDGVSFHFPDDLLLDAIAHVDVPTTTADRALHHESLSPKQSLQRAVMERIIQRGSLSAIYSPTEQEVSAALELQRSNLESNDRSLRAVAMRSFIRAGAEVCVAATSTGERALVLSALAAVGSEPERADPWLTEQLRQGEARAVVEFGHMCSMVATLFQCQIRPHFTLAQFNVAVMSALDGSVIRHGVIGEVEKPVERPTGAGGENESWQLFGITVDALFRVFFEPIDPVDPFVDPSQD